MNYQEQMNELKKYICYTKTKDVEKELADAYEEELNDECKIGAFCYDINDDLLECYIYVQSKTEVVSCLLYKTFSNSKDAYHYFNYLKEIVLSKDLNKLLEECTK